MNQRTEYTLICGSVITPLYAYCNNEVIRVAIQQMQYLLDSKTFKGWENRPLTCMEVRKVPSYELVIRLEF